MKRHPKKIPVITRRSWTKAKLKQAIRDELDKKPGLYCLDLCKRLGADLRDIGECLDELLAEKKIAVVKQMRKRR